MAVNRQVAPDNIKIAFWNACGLNNKRNELEEFLVRAAIDIALVSETHLQPYMNPKIRNYQMYRKDRDRAGGGTAIYVKQNLDHSEIDLPVLQTLEANAVVLNTNSMGPIRVVSAYQQPTRNIIPADFDDVFNSPLPTIVAGDLNSKHRTWNSRIANTRGRALAQYVATRAITVAAPDAPTHFSSAGHRPDVLDIALLNRITTTYTIHVVNELSSDHNPVILELTGAEPCDVSIPRGRVDWEVFQTTMEDNIGLLPVIKTRQQLDEAVQDITTKMQASIRTASSARSRTANNTQLPQDIVTMIRDRNRARRRWQRTADPVDRVAKNRLATQVHDALRELRNQRWRELLDDMDENENSMWRISKALRVKRNPVPAIHSRNGLVYTAADKAEAIAEELEQQCSPSYQHADVDFISTVHRQVRTRLRADSVLNPSDYITPKVVQDKLKKVKTKKAPGPDGIPGTALRVLPRKAVVALTNIVNAMFRLAHYPTSWKLAHVITLPKPGKDHKFAANYRPISLLSLLGKLAESLIRDKLQAHTTQLDVLPEEQHGFREQHSTNHQLVRVADFITEAFNRRHAAGGIFLDVAKAFDRVWHRGLLFKLLDYGYPLHTIKLIASYLHRRSLMVRLDGSLSSERPITAGVPQGSILGPLLFNIYVSDFPKAENQAILAQYADDTAVLYRSRTPRQVTRRLQELTDNMEEWCRDWRVDINAEKSAAILFSRRRIQPFGHVNMFGSQIPWHNKTKYLGVTFDKRLTWHEHIDSCTAKAQSTAGRLYPMLGKKSVLSLRNKLRLYKSTIRPQMLYAAPVWGIAARTHLKRLEARQCKILRLITSAPWYVKNDTIRRDTKTPTINDVIMINATRLYEKMATHSSRQIRGVASTNVVQSSKHKRPVQVLQNTVT